MSPESQSKPAALESIRVRIRRVLVLVVAAIVLGLVANAINPDGIPLIQTVPIIAGR